MATMWINVLKSEMLSVVVRQVSLGALRSGQQYNGVKYEW